MTFSEFLIADDSENLVEVMRQIKDIKEIPKIFEDRLIEKLKIYYIIRGMPEAVYSWVNDKDIEKVNRIQKNILDLMKMIFQNIPKQVKQIKYL